MSTKTKRITESAMLLAVALVLELISKLFIPEFPFGGQITVVCMLPVVLCAYRHGLKWGLVTAFTYSLLQMVLGAKTVSAAFMPGYFGDEALLGKAILMCLLDYVAAFSVLFLGGIFRNRIQKPGLSLMCGSLVALGARYLIHILSGYILFADYAQWFFSLELLQPWGSQLMQALSPETLGLVYSVVYNGCYMVPEMLLTALAALFLARVPRTVTKITA